MKEHTIKLHDSQKDSAMRIFSNGVVIATSDIKRILSLAPGRALFTGLGTRITLGMAVKKRRFCMRKFNQIRRGFIV